MDSKRWAAGAIVLTWVACLTSSAQQVRTNDVFTPEQVADM
jgi:hypothetical protein